MIRIEITLPDNLMDKNQRLGAIVTAALAARARTIKVDVPQQRDTHIEGHKP